MALVRALARKNLRDLTIIAPGGGLDVDLLVGCGAVRRVLIGVCSLDLVGPAPYFRRAAEAGVLDVVDFGGAALARALEAASRGLPEVPVRVLLGSDLRRFHPGREDASDPAILHLPALAPDVALVHAERADADGNLRFFAPSLDEVIAWSAKHVVASVEQVMPRDALPRWGYAGVPGARVDVLVHAPLGAHPTGCYPDYAPDYESLIEYAQDAEAGSSGDALRDRWIGADEQRHRAQLTPGRVLELRSLASSGAFLTCRP